MGEMTQINFRVYKDLKQIRGGEIPSKREL